MFRKLMAGVVLCSVPVLSFGVAQIATTGTAWAGGTTTCTGTSSAGQVVRLRVTGALGPGNRFGECQVDDNHVFRTALVPHQ